MADVRIIAGVRNFLIRSGEGVWRRCKKDEEKNPHFWMRRAYGLFGGEQSFEGEIFARLIEGVECG